MSPKRQLGDVYSVPPTAERCWPVRAATRLRVSFNSNRHPKDGEGGSGGTGHAAFRVAAMRGIEEGGNTAPFHPYPGD